MHRTEFEKMVESVRQELDESKKRQLTVWELQDELAKLKKQHENLERYTADVEAEIELLRHELDIAQGDLEARRAQDEMNEFGDPFLAAIRDSEAAEHQKQLDAERYERWQVEQENKSQREAIRELRAIIEGLQRRYS